VTSTQATPLDHDAVAAAPTPAGAADASRPVASGPSGSGGEADAPDRLRDRDPAAPSGPLSAAVFGHDLPLDRWLFLAVACLVALGIVMVYSASAWIGHQSAGSWEYYLQRHLVFFAIGAVGMLTVAHVDYRVLRRVAPQLMLVALLGLVAVLVLGREVNGAKRWIQFGSLSIQPSELAKIALAVFVAAVLARQGERVRDFRTGFLPVMAAAVLTMLLVSLEKDLGTTILLGSLTLVLLFVAGTRASYVVAAVMLAVPVVWYQIVGVAFRSNRLAEWEAGGSYQVKQGLIAIGSGGWLGVGLGNGRQKLGHLPEVQTDFILANVGEELGLVGLVGVLLLFTVIVWRGVVISRHAPDRFGAYLAIGIASTFGLQVLVNVAVVLNVIPSKGITLPFLSYGGSSLVASMVAVGLLLSISRRPTPWSISDMRRAVVTPRRKQTRVQPARANASNARPNRRLAPA
jgi:cell division protein FtsW